MSEQNENPNAEAHWEIQHILENADKGFYIIAAPPLMQPGIAEKYAKLPTIAQGKQVAIYNYADNTAPFKFSTLSRWMEANDSAGVYFLLNMQLAFPLEDEDALYQLNMCRDLLASRNKVWLFFMSSELEKRLNLTVLDFYDYVREKVRFEEEKKIAHTLESLGTFDDALEFIPEKIANDLLAQYAVMEKELMELPIEGTSEKQLLSAANTLRNIAKVYWQRGQYLEELQLLEQVKMIKEYLLDKEHPDIVAIYNGIALTYHVIGNNDKALELYKNVLTLGEKVHGSNHTEMGKYHNNISEVYRALGNYKEALVHHLKSLEIREKILGKEHPRTAISYSNIAETYRKLGEYATSLAYHQKAMKIREKKLGLQNPYTAESYNDIAFLYFAQGDYSQSLSFLIKSYQIYTNTIGKSHIRTEHAKKNMVLVYTAAGYTAPFEEWLSRQISLEEKL